MSGARQFSFTLPVNTAYRREDFALSDCNQAAFRQVVEWPQWGQPLLVLQGPPASGKTHLANIWAAQSHARCMSAAQLTRDAAQAIIEAGEAGSPWVVEGLETLADETALFHLLNAVREQQGWLLMTTSHPPAQLPVTLPDLRSRLHAAPLAVLDGPDDAALMAAVQKQFADRQLRVSDEVVRYLLMRMDRSYAAAREWVARIDAAALREQRKITIVLVRELLESEF